MYNNAYSFRTRRDGIMIKASVIGATGYAGVELVRLLAEHPDVEIAYLSSQSHEGEEISDHYPSLKGTL